MAFNPLATLLGAFAPAAPIAQEIIVRTLRGNGLNPTEYPVKALGEHAVRSAKFQARVYRTWYRTKLYDTAESIAHIAIYITLGQSTWSARNLLARPTDGDELPEVVWDILAKHDPARFAPENLAATQARETRRISAGVQQ